MASPNFLIWQLGKLRPREGGLCFLSPSVS